MTDAYLPSEVRDRMRNGAGTLLVCAYDSDDKFRTVRLQGAIPLSDLRSRLPSLPLDQEMVFYCA